jgi:hypothetical protein
MLFDKEESAIAKVMAEKEGVVCQGRRGGEKHAFCETNPNAGYIRL